jgi:hypothetical protein
LPADLKKVIDANSGSQTAALFGRAMDQGDVIGRKLIEQAGNRIIVLDPAETQRFQRAASGVRAVWFREVATKFIGGQKLAAEAEALIVKYGSKWAVSAGRERSRVAVAVDGHVGQVRLGHLDHLRVGRVALCIDADVYGDRSPADALDLGIEAQQVADGHRLLEDELVHCDGGDASLGDACRQYRAGHVHLGHDPASEDVAVAVDVGRQRHHPQHQRAAVGQTQGAAEASGPAA